MLACPTLVTDPFTGKPTGCPGQPTWRRHHGGGKCSSHQHTLYCDEHAPYAAPRDQFTPATDTEGIYDHDPTHPRQRRTAPREE